MTTNLDVVYRLERLPGEWAMAALGKMREVYGIRKVSVDSVAGLIRVEFDFTRLTREAVAHLLRRAGFDIAEEVPLWTSQPSPENVASAPR